LEKQFDALVNEKAGRSDEPEDGRPRPPLDLKDPDIRDKIAEAIVSWNKDFPNNNNIPDIWKKNRNYPEDDTWSHEPPVGGTIINPNDDIEKIHDTGPLNHDSDNNVPKHTSKHGGDLGLGETSHEYNDLEDFEADQEDHLGMLLTGDKEAAQNQVSGLTDSSLVQMDDETDVPPDTYDNADVTDHMDRRPRHVGGALHHRHWHKQRNPWDIALTAQRQRLQDRRHEAMDEGRHRQRVRQFSAHRSDRELSPWNGHRDRLAYQGVSRHHQRGRRTSMELQPRSFRNDRGYRPKSDWEDRGADRIAGSMPSEQRQRYNNKGFQPKSEREDRGSDRFAGSTSSEERPRYNERGYNERDYHPRTDLDDRGSDRFARSMSSEQRQRYDERSFD